MKTIPQTLVAKLGDQRAANVLKSVHAALHVDIVVVVGETTGAANVEHVNVLVVGTTQTTAAHNLEDVVVVVQNADFAVQNRHVAEITTPLL